MKRNQIRDEARNIEVRLRNTLWVVHNLNGQNNLNKFKNAIPISSYLQPEFNTNISR